MNTSNQKYPYKKLGTTLQQMRVRRQESLAEVSGAVEIDVDALSAYEAGADRPSEDVLLLLISYFSVKEEDAVRIWQLAGYNAERFGDDANDEAQQHTAAQVVVMPMDLRIVYTDMVHVTVNDFGLVMNFMQTAGPSNKPLAIARVGMSREHAKSVLDVLQKTLAQSEQKQLPSNAQDQEVSNT